MSYTTVDKVKATAKNIELTGTKTQTMSSTEVNYFLDWADQVINSKLGSCYYVPLNQITRNGATSYPFPIDYIATRLAAAWLVESIYSRIEPDISEAGKVHKDNAMKELDELYKGSLGGSRMLEGQKRKARNSFVDPYIIPLEPPQQSQY